MAARMRAMNSLTHRSRHDSDAAKDAKIEHEIPQRMKDEPQRIEIPFIETRHLEEEAQLLASRSRMAALQTDVQAANKSREDACIFDLWTAFQELHLNLAVRRRKGSRRRTLLQLGMMVRLLLSLGSLSLSSGMSSFTGHHFDFILTGRFRICTSSC